MNVLIVDDEVGIREGVASFVRLKGHTVQTAGSVREAFERIEQHDFDAVISDWRLGDEVAREFVCAVDVPCLVMSGHPDDVDGIGATEVAAKPIMPLEIVEWIEQAGVPAADAGYGELPLDTRERVEHIREICGSVEIVDDGAFVTVLAPLPSDEVLPQLEECGGDLRVLTPDGETCVEIRLFRDGRPDDSVVVTPFEPEWPAAGDVAVDFDVAEFSTFELTAVLDRMRSVRRRGQAIHALNVAKEVRRSVDALGRSDELPMKPMAGPQLPAVLSELWS